MNDMSVPANPKIYHIVHLDRLPSILAEGALVSDSEVIRRSLGGTTIGMSTIKQRRLQVLQLTSHPGLYVGACVPFYFCPRSVMLYLIYQGNDPDLAYRSGQQPILHLEADLRQTVAWANQQRLRWAFTLAGITIPGAVMSERIGERHASACRYKNEIPEGSRHSARRTHFWPREV